jgi:hypothetical protein
MDCTEAIISPSNILRKPLGRSPYTHRVFAAGDERYRRHVFDCIRAYSARKLSYDSEILNGVLGVFKYLGRLPQFGYHIWGIPVTKCLGKAKANGDSSALNIDIWINAFPVGLSREASRSCERRLGFPTWSWTGWKFSPGSSRYEASFFFRYSIGDIVEKMAKDKSDIKIWVELRDGTIMDLTEYQLSGKAEESPSQLSPYLHIDSLVIEFQFVYNENWHSSSWKSRDVKIIIDDDIVHVHVASFLEESIHSGESHSPRRYGNTGDKVWTGIAFPMRTISEQYNIQAFVLIIALRCGAHERVGSMILSCLPKARKKRRFRLG